MQTLTFPEDFLFGVATSAAQIEGAAGADGRGASIWDAFARQPGAIADGSTPETACDFYHRYPMDLTLARQLGVQSLRFSFSWSRIFPQGTGRINQAGLDFYRRLMDVMMENGLMPNATLYHWDLPQALQERGGWLNRDVAQWFADYAATLFQTFGKTIPLWTTVNEPIATYVGYGEGIFAPGGKDPAQGRQANHHLLLAHGEAVKRFRQAHIPGSKIGVVVDIWKHHPLRPDHPQDCAMAELANEKTYRSYLSPIFMGAYTPQLCRYMEQEQSMPVMRPGDMETISQPLDFFGLNVYNRVVDCADPQYARQAREQSNGGNFQDDGGAYPKAIYDALHILRDEYKLHIPIYITENGTRSSLDACVCDGQVHDTDRIRYMQGFLYWLHRAMEEGIDVRGYYAWSLLDNWEWIAGYAARYGLVHVDYATQRRTVKDSGKWYAQLAATRTMLWEEEAQP